LEQSTGRRKVDFRIAVFPTRIFQPLEQKIGQGFAYFQDFLLDRNSGVSVQIQKILSAVNDQAKGQQTREMSGFAPQNAQASSTIGATRHAGSRFAQAFH
jgi:hypothetical protein